MEKSELVSKIKAELEFAQQHMAKDALPEDSAPVRKVPHPSAPVRKEPVRKETERQNEDISKGGAADTIRSLETKIMELTVDVKWRSNALDQLKRENEVMLENMHGQARYIGHLESDLMRLGGKPDQQFLAAPNVKSAQSEETALTSLNDAHITEPSRPHPDSQNLYSG